MTKGKTFYLTICAFGFGLASNMQVAYLSTLLLFLGFKTHLITYIWLIAPLSGMIVQPILGLISDNFYSRWGQRKPLFFIFMILGTISLIFFSFIKNTYLMIFIIILFDISINGNSLLSRALILDNTSDNTQRSQAFSWYTALSGLGAMVAGFLPWIIINLFYSFSTTKSNNIIPTYIHTTFIIGATFYLITSLATLLMIREKPKEAISSWQKKPVWFVSKKSLSIALKKLPKNIAKISLILFFAWVAIFSVWNFLNISIAQVSLNMPIESTDNIKISGSYLAEANVLTSAYFGILQISSTIFAILIPFFIRYTSIYSLFAIGLGIGSISLILIAFIANKLLIAVIIFFYGICWAVIATCPYIIFGNMNTNQNNCFLMGILNVLIVFPQILTGLVLGLIYKYFFLHNARYVIILAGISLLISSGLCLNKYYTYINIKKKIPVNIDASKLQI